MEPDRVAGEVVALVGYMGSGKSSVGRELARSLGWTFIDLDHEIERSARKSIARIFADSGEDGFRELETECLRDEISTPRSGHVISCGGGIVTREENRKLLRLVPTIFIREDIGVLFRRTRNSKRPLRGGDRREFEDRYLEREPLYEEVADYTVTVRGRRQREISQEVASWLGR